MVEFKLPRWLGLSFHVVGFILAKHTSDIFSDDAIEEIFHASVGSPRLINKVCTHALIYGAQREKGVLSASDIRFVIEQEI